MEIEPGGSQDLVPLTSHQIEQATPLKGRQRWSAIFQNPDVRSLPGVVYRSSVNSVLLIPDTIPGVGVVTPFILDGLKFFSWYCKLRGLDPKILDLTPDVGKGFALATSTVVEPIQFVTQAPLPSHAAEASIQFLADGKKVKRAWKAIRRISGLKTIGEFQRYQVERYVATLKPPIPTYPFFPSDATPEEIVTKYIPRPDV